MFKKLNIILILIIFLAAVIRFWNLGVVPPSPDWDEASLGYNAYSIMLTGRDEYGKFLPVVLRSFDDYKPALYSYLTIPFIRIFGLNIFSVRFPSALFGVLTVLATYYLVRELIPNYKSFKIRGIKISLAELSALLLAISPWHIQFSRIAFESNVGLALNIFVFLFFLKGLKKAPYLLLSLACAALAVYVYQAEKVFTPLLLLILIIIYWRDLLKVDKKYIFLSVLIGVVFLSPMAYEIISDKNSLLRAKGVSVFSDQTEFLKRNAQKIIFDKKNNALLGLILDNRRIEYAKAIMSGYASHFDFNWLFITGDISRHHAPFMGLLYLFEFPFVFAGLYQLVFGAFDRRAKLAVFAYFFLVPVPASVTSGVPHAVRTLNFLPVFQIFAASGLIEFLLFINKIKYKILSFNLKFLIIGIFIALFVLNFSYFLNQYFRQLNFYYSKDWQYGYKDAVAYVSGNLDKYNKIIVSNKAPLDQSYMFFLFYLKYPPSLYQKEAKSASGGFKEEHFFGKFEFRSIDWAKDQNLQRVLFVGRPSDFPQVSKALTSINYLNGEEAIKIVEQ